MTEDEFPRPTTSLEVLGKLRPLNGGGVTTALLFVGVVAYALLARLHPERQYWHDIACGTRLITWRPARPQSRAEATGQNPAP